MNKNIKQLFVAIYDGKVVFFDTNLKSFIEKLKKAESGEERSLSTFQRIFKKKTFDSYANEDGKLYLLQKLKIE